MVERWSRWFGEHRTLPDALLALALFVLSAPTLGQSGEPTAVELLMTVALLLPLLFRRAAPEAMVGVTAAICLLQVLLLSRPLMADLVVLVAVHTAAAHIADRRWGLATAATAVVGSVLAGLRWFGRNDPSVLVLGIAVGVIAVTAALVLGRWQRERRERTADQLAAARERTVLLEREHQQRLQVSAAAERARIARELHDIVAHSLSVVIVQADGAAAASEVDPSVAPAALATIADTGREALAEMRRMIGVLRTGGDLDPDGAAERDGRGSGPADAGFAPMPQLTDIPDLVAQVRRTGLDVTLTLPDPVPEVPAGLGLTVYRVVQESLTNVLKHAGPDPSVDVRVAATPSRLLVVVTDDGRGAAAWGAGQPLDQGGHGLTGMRERVVLQGGTVQAAPRVGGGFQVVAELPVPTSVGPVGAGRR
ncbi:sensor histidine kinase [Nakamurella leprariae]|uniref:histidine kinase n=1 Tax=Nakamurella leprariae TaxID=2803911 RepID=A0A938YFI2_9ACTN|nr:histidine kinase [Nakamurella leprariae]MBM9468934.1 hypothetical protein [Nakamurella leprariae]